jgi:hypothetical protein
MRLRLKAINPMRTLLIALMMTLATQAGAGEILMECRNTLYRYSDPFFGKAKIEIRKEAAWEPICVRAGQTSDRGGKCVIIKNVAASYSVEVDDDYIKNAKNILKDRLAYCRKFQSRLNGATALKKVKWSIALAARCSPDEISEFQGWDFDQNKPANEIDEFWKLNDASYFAQHLPKRGTYRNRYRKNQKFKVRIDFITLTEHTTEIVFGEERNKYPKSCKLK